MCACLPHLTQANVVCDIKTQTHHCPAGMWIGNFSGGITTHPHCPYDYCKSQRPSVSLTSQHEQCQFSRSGVLCGACRGDLSLCLGTSQCKKCSSFNIFLLLPFMMAGVVLVFLLFKCNLTVSYGTINGLIFYANIIRANQAIFFSRDRVGILVSFFSTCVYSESWSIHCGYCISSLIKLISVSAGAVGLHYGGHCILGLQWNSSLSPLHSTAKHCNAQITLLYRSSYEVVPAVAYEGSR